MNAKPGASSIIEVDYANHGFPNLGIEAKPLTDIVDSMPAAYVGRPHRLGFHHLMLVEAGHGTHAVDFEQFTCRPGTVVHVRPGQVHQYDRDGAFAACTVLFMPSFMLPEPAMESESEMIALDGSSLDRIRSAFAAVTDEYRVTDGSVVSQRILQHQLHALLLLVGRQAGMIEMPRASDRYRRAYRRFLDQLEQRFVESRRVEDYARELGYSAKTLGRACLAAAGMTPKTLIERRVALEAKRLLAHSTLPINALAVRLGFSETTNFVKFFRRMAGSTPTQFRARQQPRARPAPTVG